jgi:hypothetical protein
MLREGGRSSRERSGRERRRGRSMLSMMGRAEGDAV